MKRIIVAIGLLLAGSPALASPLPRVTPFAEKPIRTIAIVLDGERLATETPPEVVEGHIVLPLRTILDAFGIPFFRSGRTLSLSVPLGEVTLTTGGESVTVNGKLSSLGSRVVEIDGTTYVPLRFLKIALGADATYDQRGARVQIVSSLIGRTDAGEVQRAGGGTIINGNISAIDSNSAPPSLTVSQSAEQTRTISVNSDALIYLEDLTVHSRVKVTLGDLHVGDRVSILLSKDGRVLDIHDSYGSDNGTVSAVSPTAIVLQNGVVEQPGRGTEILLNGSVARLVDLAVGDYVTVRYNPKTREIRQIVASRTASATPTAQPVSGEAKVSSFSLSATRPLHAGESFDLRLQGTPGGRATFDIGDYLTGLEMREESPGVYRGHFTIPDRFNVAQVPIYGHLSVGGTESARAEASTLLSAATTPPQIPEVAPPPGQTVNNPRPNIYATFVVPAQIPINVSSVVILVNGHDVTSSATRTPAFIAYSPGVDYPDGEMKVTVKVSDAAGNVASRTWTFTIKTR